MLTTFLLVIAELALLFWLSRSVIQIIYTLFYTVFRSRPVGISAISLIFFPGTVIHELAHLFVAEILGVRTGGLTLVPESMEQSEVRTGSVMIAQTDPVRRTMIGIAPLFVGIIAIAACSYFVSTQYTELMKGTSELWSNPSLYLLLVGSYLLFSISNSMFSSKEDLKGSWPVFVVIALVATGGYVVGFGISLSGQILEIVRTILDTMFRSLALVLALNGIVLLLFRILIDLIGKRRS